MNKVYSLLFLISSVLFSCSSDVGNFQIGEGLVDTKSSLIITDTFSVKLSTVIIDSIPTSGTTQLLCGKYTNSITGSTELLPYFNFDLSESRSSMSEDDIFDSITVKLGYSGYYIGDTTRLQEINLYRLDEQLEFIDSETTSDYLFNNSSFQREEEPLGMVRFYPRVSEDSLEFRISDEFGEELLNLILSNSKDVESNTNFNAYLRGFVLKSGSENTAILGFTGDTSGVKLNLYTHLIDYEQIDKKYTFNLAAEGTHFNQAVSDRSGTSFASLWSQRESIPSTESDNQTFIAGGAGVVTRINFPSLNDIFSFDDRVMVKAQLVIRPSLYNEMDYIPETLHFYETDRRNRLGDQLTITSSSRTVSVEAILKPDDDEPYDDEVEPYPEEYYYIADITQYLLDKLSGNYYDTKSGVLLTVPYTDLQSKADLLILNGENSSQYLPKLKLYFLKYE